VTANEYLNDLLNQQQLQETELNGLRTMRDTIQKQLSVLEGNPRFYYAGSYGKLTIIRQRYDLDIVMYWPSDVPIR
jgi:tRNA nucleotidyltransferase (CCA-adding enzyme)